MRFGFHVSIEGSLHKCVQRAVDRGCEVFQIFFTGPLTWKQRIFSEDEIDEFKRQLKISGNMSFYTHAPYLVNLCSQDDQIYKRSLDMMLFGVRQSIGIGARALSFHIGSHRTMDYKQALKRLTGALDLICQEASGKLLIALENSSGQGNSIGSSFNQIAEILSMINTNNIGICIDTCHAYAAGYDLVSADGYEKFKNEIEKNLGYNRIFLIHLNDSKKPLSSGTDRHENIGSGYIGLDGFRKIANDEVLKGIDAIMETPGRTLDLDLQNMKTIRSLVS
ncbi:MAG: deoxyribonuclease IV [Actinobacteria bacterium]|nr:deoxyribonuclease IV [Actinomycetota bacterium]